MAIRFFGEHGWLDCVARAVLVFVRGSERTREGVGGLPTYSWPFWFHWLIPQVFGFLWWWGGLPSRCTAHSCREAGKEKVTTWDDGCLFFFFFFFFFRCEVGSCSSACLTNPALLLPPRRHIHLSFYLLLLLLFLGGPQHISTSL